MNNERILLKNISVTVLSRYCKNLGICIEKKTVRVKRGRKIKPGLAIQPSDLMDVDFSIDPMPDIASCSKVVDDEVEVVDEVDVVNMMDSDSSENDIVVIVPKRKPTARTASGKQKEVKEKVVRKKKKKDDDIWICGECSEDWDEEGDSRWIECDMCGEHYHLEHSGLKYQTQDYWTIKLDNTHFECYSCKELFKGI